MVFVDRKAKYPGRWTMKKSDGTSEIVTLVRNDEPEVEGTPMNAETLNTLSDVAGADVARIQAEVAREAAAGSATEAAGSASTAEKSKTAAATSESNAAKHEEAAKKAAEEAGAKAGTDKTLSIENAPADAKATGDALAGKVDKGVILDEDGNVIFYSKAAVDELLAGKLDLTGGTMAGKLEFTSYMVRGGSILLGEEDAANAPGEPLNNLVIRSWNGVSFTTDCDDQPYTGKTAVGIDCREGIVKAVKFEGTADNSIKWDNLFLRRKHNTSDTWIPVFSDNNVDYVLKNEIANLNGVAASGSNYVRFTDGAQICWGILQSTVTFPVAFATTSYGVSVSGATTLSIPSFPYIIEKTVTNMKISSNNGDSYIAIGRWK